LNSCNPSYLKGKVELAGDFDTPMRLDSDQGPASEKKWVCEVVDAGDGSGNLMFTFPPAMLEIMRWREGTELNFDILPGNRLKVWNSKYEADDGQLI